MVKNISSCFLQQTRACSQHTMRSSCTAHALTSSLLLSLRFLQLSSLESLLSCCGLTSAGIATLSSNSFFLFSSITLFSPPTDSGRSVLFDDSFTWSPSAVLRFTVCVTANLVFHVSRRLHLIFHHPCTIQRSHQQHPPLAFTCAT